MSAKNGAIDATLTLPGISRPVGRPRTGKAMTGAERQARYRKSHARIETGDRMTQTIKRLADQFGLTQAQVTRELIRFALCNRNWSRAGFPSLSNGNG